MDTPATTRRRLASNLRRLRMSKGLTQEAVAQPTVDASGRDTLVDSRIPDDVRDGLVKMGHRVEAVEEGVGAWAFARPSAIQIDYESGLLRAGVEVFSPSLAIGY